MKEQDLEIAIIGAGVSGICLGINLLRQGIHNFKIFEKSTSVGGNWAENSYPGCGCDSPAHLYSFSFNLNPHWKSHYATRDEAKAYLEDTVDRFSLKKYIRFNTEVSAIEYNEAEKKWWITTADGKVINARFVALAIGVLNQPKIPKFEKLETYQGPAFHTARWNHSVDLKDKNVAVIGTAASAIQVIPELAKTVKNLFVFQRSPNYILARNDLPYSAKTKNRFRRHPWLMRFYRWWLYWQREKRYFLKGGRQIARDRQQAIENITRQVQDKTLHPKLIPQYEIGCKHVLFSDTYYETLNRNNVHLCFDSIVSFYEQGLKTQTDIFSLDAVVFATGFDTWQTYSRIDVVGPQGKTLLATLEKQRSLAYYGTLMSGFPNLFIINGPATGQGHQSFIFMFEQQVAMVIRLIKAAQKRKLQSIDLKSEVHSEFERVVGADLDKSVWASGCTSFYLNPAGRPVMWPYKTSRFWWETRRVGLDRFNVDV